MPNSHGAPAPGAVAGKGPGGLYTRPVRRRKGSAILRLWHSLSPNARGALFAFVASFFFAAQSAGIKSLAGEIGIWQVVFVRQFLLALFILPFVIRHRSFATRRPAAHATRAALGVAGFVLYAYAISNAPLAIATALSFTKVLFTVLVAIVFLDERVGWRRWTAVIVGFLGVLVILRPGAAPLDWALVAALADGFLVAFIVLTLKHLTRTERPETIIFYFGLFSALLMAAPAALTWTWPNGDQWARLVGLSALGTLGQAFVVRAWAIGEASALAPVGYVQLVFAALIGYALFAEVPDVWTWVGTAVIVGSTLYITLREARLKRRPAADPQAQPTAAE